MMTREDAIREFGLSPERKVVTVIGGSQGSKAINRIILDAVDALTDRYKLQLIWQTGKLHYDKLKYVETTSSGVRLFPFLEQMGQAYSAADLVISRAGAVTLAEIARYGKPSILIPFPHASADHQTVNANSFKRAGAAAVIPENELTTQRLLSEIESLISDRSRMSQMGKAAALLSVPNSADRIVDRIICLAMA